MTENKRLQLLEKMTAAGQADSFAWYGLALEYRKEARLDEAVATFESLREKDPEYLAMYLMAGQVLLEREQQDAARLWLEQGIALATKQGNSQALGELEDALADC